MINGCAAQNSEIVVVAPTPPGGSVVRVPVPTRSLATSRYRGMEKRSVTLLPNVRVTKAQLMAGMDKSTLLIIVRNHSGHLLTGSTQLLLDAANLNSGGYYGKGPLFPGEMRVIKARNIGPAWVTLVWHRKGLVKRGFAQNIDYTGGRWKSSKPVDSGQPLVFTILPNDKIRVTRNFNGIIGN
jgi:hypothetical protein